MKNATTKYPTPGQIVFAVATVREQLKQIDAHLEKFHTYSDDAPEAMFDEIVNMKRLLAAVIAKTGA